MSEDKKRTPEEIEADLARTRLELTTTVDELSERLDPRRQVEALKTEATATLNEVTDRAKAFTERVKSGDTTALGILGGSVAAVALLVVLKVRQGR
ncbi:DUF3618 domain-containing protein [Georgenia sp. 10Sc9-8]|uniref:DUF3618 domain-containing protein n=1 Tax=Georgenia halotolerans TaxID=3028317 RepID=A0ABT5TYC6_9MICO|nr:DUF3618 domain-containing protein [Georgenia halotolerans]